MTVEEKNFKFIISQELIRALEKQTFDLVSNGGYKKGTPLYPIGEELDEKKPMKLRFRDRISFGTITRKNEIHIVVFKGILQINIPYKKQDTCPIVGSINFKTGIGSYSFYKRK
jgi:hypothetical protein